MILCSSFIFLKLGKKYVLQDWVREKHRDFQTKVRENRCDFEESQGNVSEKFRINPGLGVTFNKNLNFDLTYSLLEKEVIKASRDFSKSETIFKQ